MKTNENSENKLEIYTIFFRGDRGWLDIWNEHGKYKNYLNNIAKKGGTENVRDIKSFSDLNTNLKNIAHSINQHYGLKYQ